jgi:TrmH family RNA methyltransferase
MPFLITSRTNPRLKQLRAALDGQLRLSDGYIGIEGEHLLEEALRSDMDVKSVFLREDRVLPASLVLPPTLEVITVAKDAFISATEAPQGIAALVTPPRHSPEELLRGKPLIVVTEALQDPGNLGTLIRTAEAFGATGLVTLSGTVSPWNQKALRASAGSALRLPIIAGDTATIDLLRRNGVRILAAVPADGIPATKAGLVEPCAILLGNEGAGLSDSMLGLADERITIPTPGPTESLNAAVAGSILLYEAARQRAGEQ